jgi:hypothetical protein
MRYKELVLKKLESLTNAVNGIQSLLSQPSLSQQQVDEWRAFINTKVEEITTLINREQDSF